MPPKSISRKFSELKQRGEVAFIPYICAGDPSLEATPRAALALEEVSLFSGAKKKREEKEGFRRFHCIAKQQHHRAEHVLHGLTPPVLSLAGRVLHRTIQTLPMPQISLCLMLKQIMLCCARLGWRRCA